MYRCLNCDYTSDHPNIAGDICNNNSCGFRSGRYEVDRQPPYVETEVDRERQAEFNRSEERVFIGPYWAFMAAIFIGHLLHWWILWLPAMFVGFFLVPCGAVQMTLLMNRSQGSTVFEFILIGIPMLIACALIYVAAAAIPGSFLRN